MMAKANLFRRLRLRRDLNKIMATIDLEALRAMREKYAGTPWYDSKHWDARTRIAIALLHAHALGLHKSPRQRILDLGTGCGYFPYVCNYLGHEASGVDIQIPMYRDVVHELCVPWQELEIRSYEPLPDPDVRYDLITAILIFFDRHHTADAWGPDEWRFFLHDIASHQLRESGKLFLVLVEDPDTRRAFSQYVEDLFRTSGAAISGNKVFFHTLDGLCRTTLQ